MIRILLAAIAALTIASSAYAQPYHHGYPQPHHSGYDRCIESRMHYHHSYRQAAWFCRNLSRH